MSGEFSFRLAKTDGGARLGEITTAHGVIRTPAFMPVGTAATVKAVYVDQLKAAGADIILGNTYHLMLRPGAERIARLGGLHAFMRWDRPILTDSGGFQVMSLAKLRKITDEGVAFQSHIDGSRAHAHAGAGGRDPMPARLRHPDATRRVRGAAGIAAGDRGGHAALAGLGRALPAAFAQFRERGQAGPGQALFGIVQGGIDAELRQQSADALVAMDLPGYAIGGLAVGEPQEAMLATLETTTPRLPADKPRYLMGVGTPFDLIESVARGIDMFDCVMPTRSGRHGQAFTWAGKVNLRNARFADDPAPLDAASSCPAARDYSRAYLHHLVKSEEFLGAMLLSWANVAFYQELMAAMRAAIADGRFAAWATETKARLSRGQGE